MEQFFFSNSVSLERGSTLQPEMAAASEPETRITRDLVISHKPVRLAACAQTSDGNSQATVCGTL